MNDVILSITDLKVHYPVKVKGKYFTKKALVKAVDGVSFDIFEGETLGIVGESGCGKSTLCRILAWLEEPTAGHIDFKGKDIRAQSREERFEYRRKVQMIFQDVYSTLDPRFTIGKSIEEPLSVHKAGTKTQRRERAERLMRDVGLDASYYNRFPHEFSGGQRQRIGVARALALNPSILVCDEPVSALDVSIQAQILNLFQDLQEKYKLTYVFVSHNLSVVRHLCDRVAVMYLGTVVELASRDELYNNPRHPYTKALIDAIPVPDPALKNEIKTIEGDVPSPINPPAGCPFSTRCKYAADICSKERPALRALNERHTVACHFADQDLS